MVKNDAVTALELVKKFIETKLPKPCETHDGETIEREYDYVEVINLLQRLRDNY